VHGTTLHGKQQFQPLSLEPLTYYHRTGPLGQLFRALPQLQHSEIAAIGLGTGSVAAYGVLGNAITFFEIDPTVRRIAENTEYFTYLHDCKAGRLDIVMGDARIKLEEHGKPGQYGLIVVDAFSSDAIPIHLLTKEAVALYVERLSDDGVIAMHVSNRYLSLQPIAARIAQELGLACLQINDGDSDLPGKQSSQWVVLARSRDHFGKLLSPPGDMTYEGRTITLTAWESLVAAAETPLWTDDFSNILSVLSW
jgi:spermidine synthase